MSSSSLHPDQQPHHPLKASQAGADEFFLCPLNFAELQIVLSRAIENAPSNWEGRRLLQQSKAKPRFTASSVAAPPCRRSIKPLRQVAGTGASVVSAAKVAGQGKLVAQAIVQCAHRADHPIVCLTAPPARKP